MKLNNTAFVHKKIRQLCLQLELLSETKLITNLDNEFHEIRYLNKYGYIIIDYNNNTIFTLGNKLTPVEQEICGEIMLCIDWLATGRSVAERGYYKKDKW